MDQPTFHPTFLYEGTWNLALATLIIWLDRTHKIRPGGLIVVWVLGYATGRLWIETLRIDFANEVLGLRVNIVTSGTAIAAASIWLLLRGRRPTAMIHDIAQSAATPPLDDAS